MSADSLPLRGGGEEEYYKETYVKETGLQFLYRGLSRVVEEGNRCAASVVFLDRASGVLALRQ